MPDLTGSADGYQRKVTVDKGRFVKFASKLLIMVMLTLLLPAMERQLADAFHDGSVGECDGCHTMHNSSGGQSMSVNALPPFMANPYLLQGSDSSSVCLKCHQQSGDFGPATYHVSTPSVEMPPGVPPKQLSPAGDFGWLKKSFSWLPALGQPLGKSDGERHGHNIRSNDFGYAQDTTKSSAPGGSYPSLSLNCISCHDPHGKYRRNQDGTIRTSGQPVKGAGSYDTSPDPDAFAAVGTYRLLGGAGYFSRSAGSSFSFIHNPPAAVAPEIYNRAENATVTRVAYGAGMSDWCRNCHTNMHDDVYPTPLKHATSGPLGATLINNYNSYVKTGDVSGFEATSYWSLVPFEIGSSSYPLLKQIVTNTPAKGPNSADGIATVMCLTCHRAHASGWDSATRWNTKTEYIVYNGRYSEEGSVYQPYGQGRSEIEAQRAYYDTPVSNFAPLQKTLCNKCHVGD
jgi:hypothetical protein